VTLSAPPKALPSVPCIPFGWPCSPPPCPGLRGFAAGGSVASVRGGFGPFSLLPLALPTGPLMVAPPARFELAHTV
jgi:hypothetical protein